MKKIISFLLAVITMMSALSFSGSARLLDDDEHYLCINGYVDPNYSDYITLNLDQGQEVKGRGSDYRFKFVPDESGVYKFYSYGNKKYNSKIYVLEGSINCFDGSDGYIVGWTYGDEYVNSGNFSISVYLHKGCVYYLEAYFRGFTYDYASFNVCITRATTPVKTMWNNRYYDHLVYRLERTKPTLSENGYEKFACAYCDSIFEDTIVPPESFSFSKTTYTYTGSAITPTVKAVDKNGNKFTYFYVTYSDNINVGKVKTVFHLTGFDKDYEFVKYFTITPKKITSCYINTNYTYTGKAITPAPYYYQKVTKTDAYGNQYVEKEKTYYKKSDYSASISGAHKQVGTYTVTYKFKGNYTGTVKKTFKILPKPVTKVKAVPYSETSVKVTWKKAANVSGYHFYRYDFKNGKWKSFKTTKSNSIVIPRMNKNDREVFFMMKTYKTVGKKKYYNILEKSLIKLQYTKPSQPVLKITNESFGEINLSFNRTANHQVQLSDNAKFSTSKDHFVLTHNADTSKTFNISGLMSGKRYYIRTREYVSVEGKMFMSAWSKTKSIETY